MQNRKRTNLGYIIFEVTPQCNLDCRYCYNIWKRPESKPEEIPTYKNIIKTLKKLFKTTEVNHITFSGGEPLLVNRIEEIVLFCRMKNKSVTIITNGNAGDDEKYKILIELGVSIFELPFHSIDPSIHDYLTNKEDSWKKSLKSIKQILKLKGNVVPVIVITKTNYMGIEKTLTSLKELGLTRIMLNRFNIGGKGIIEKDNLILSTEELNYAFKTANQTAQKLNLQLSSNVCTPLCIIDPKNYPYIRFSACNAKIINLPITLDSNGNLRICNHSPYIIGNIFKHKIENILKSEYIKNWETTVPDYCNDCTLFNKCLGGCRAASEQSGLSIRQVDPIVTGYNNI